MGADGIAARILVIEDERKVANFIKRGLEEEGYEVLTVTSGEEGRKLALEKPLELIMLDWMLPRIDGIGLLKDLRANKILTPVLMLTAKDSVENIITGLDSGSDDYLTKPFALAELLARVRAILRRTRGRGAEIRFHDLRLDPVAHRAWRKGETIALTDREYGLLYYFMRNVNHPVTRTMIAEHVWDGTFDGLTNVIDVYVNCLRKKIDNGDGRRLIHTVRGTGYVLRGEE
jgi:DNA-binding response OmpR family regulator